MDYAACNIIYVDRRAGGDKLAKRGPAQFMTSDFKSDGLSPADAQAVAEHPDVRCNLETLLGTFSEVHVCSSGASCISKLSELHEASVKDLIPTLVLVDIPYDDHRPESHPNRTPSPMSNHLNRFGPNDVEEAFYGLSLLRCIALDIQQQTLSKLVVPIAVVTIPAHNQVKTSSPEVPEEPSRTKAPNKLIANLIRAGAVTMPLDQIRIMKYLDVGAVDVLTGPLLTERLPSLAIHAYAAHKESLKDRKTFLELKRGRKRSWVGLDDEKPYAYLREAMVSGLMDGICRLGGEDLPLNYLRLSVSLDRREKIATAIGTWYFSAHDFTEDELIYAASLMLRHALAMPELEQWRISIESLTGFLAACRAAYNAFVPYHNFRHVIDVLQAVFYFFLQLGTLMPYPEGSESSSRPKSAIAALLRPFDALTLLITAIGHDVGHPGVNNAFLVTLNAPLAQLYNDRSVLESFHCAAYSQILRRHWPAAFSGVEMRQLMISSILATDMGLHFDYMKKLGFLQEKLHENGGTDGFNGRLLEEYRALACALLIKCADISNVVRRYEVAVQWTMILTDEFARQASMESDLGIPTALFAPPIREMVELGQSQLSFMNMFAIPLFQGVTDIMPAMQFCVDELHRNIAGWTARIEKEQKAEIKEDPTEMDGMFSPRSMSLAFPSDVENYSPTGVRSRPDASLSSKAQGPIHQKLSGLEGVTERDFQDVSYQSPSDMLRGDAIVDSNGAIDGDPLILPIDNSAPRLLKPQPRQLQVGQTVASTAVLFNRPNQSIAVQDRHEKTNGIQVDYLPVTDAVIRDQPTPAPRPDSSSKHHGPQRTSDTTEGSNSAPGSHDWTSQATSATTSKIPLSPSTRGTSIMSNDSTDRTATTSPIVHPISFSDGSTTRTNTIALQSCATTPTPSDNNIVAKVNIETDMAETRNGSGVTIIETMKSLARKSSRTRFRMSFWKKKGGSSAPPLPTGMTTGEDNNEDARRWSRGRKSSEA